MVYQAVVAAVLLYGCESWVLPPSQLRALEGFHIECAWRLMGMRPQKVKSKWVYPKSAEVLKKANLKPLRHYIQKRRHTVYGAVPPPPYHGGVQGGGAAERLRPPQVLVRSGGGGSSSRWDGDADRRRRQAEELTERGIFVGEFAEGAQA